MDFEVGSQATVDELQEINLDTNEEFKPTYVIASLTSERLNELKTLLCKYKGCFTWNYNENNRFITRCSGT